MRRSAYACRVCDEPVASARDGVVFHVGDRHLALCAAHARIAQGMARAGAVILGRAALAGLEARYPEAVESARRGAVLSEHIGEALRRAYDEREVLGLQPVEVAQRPPMRVRAARTATPRRPKRRQHEVEIIDAEIVEEVKL